MPNRDIDLLWLLLEKTLKLRDIGSIKKIIRDIELIEEGLDREIIE